jgi:hypothetical protein
MLRRLSSRCSHQELLFAWFSIRLEESLLVVIAHIAGPKSQHDGVNLLYIPSEAE